MEYVQLGRTGLTVSKIAFGTLPMGPVQRNAPQEDCVRLLQMALEQGITLLDTAQLYQTYPHIREALKGSNREVVIATKCGKADYAGMEDAVEEARQQLDRDIIDIFLLHGVFNLNDLEKRRQGAWQCLLEMKQKGIIRAIGISAHDLDVIEAAGNWDDLDVIHPIINKVNFGIINPSNKDPLEVVRQIYEKGVGIYAMKPLAGGNLYKDVPAALRFVFDFPYLHSIAIGMVKPEELAVNMKLYNRQPVSEEELRAAASNKRVFIGLVCQKCGQCLDVCDQGAITMGERTAVINPEKCLLCGYCRRSCPFSAIRVV